jgi:ketosteroid isomerase-like protein
MRVWPLLLVFSMLIASPPGGAADDSTQSVRSAVERVIHAQQDAWNRGDLEGFMAGYWNSPDLTFFSRGQATAGWQGALEHYRKAYQGEGREMGRLEFSDLKIEPLDADAAFARGAYLLLLSHGKTPRGLFTLVFRRFPDGWKIIHDHTSAAE